jgi:nucleoside-diphosphate-sugar epimerase
MKDKKVVWEGSDVCLVTGGAGFIGSYLVRELANQGKKVIALDYTPDARYISDCLDRVTYVYGSVADMPHFSQLVADYGVDLIFHLGYLLVPDTDAQLGRAIQVNCAGFQNVLEAARIHGVRRVVWASSQAVYGLEEGYPSGPISEDQFVQPNTFYGACKLLNEHMARFYRQTHGLDNMGFRKSVVYGLGKSRRRDLSISHMLVENAILGRPLQMPPVDFFANYIYVRDVVRGYLLAAQAPPTDRVVFNLGGFVYRCNEVVDILREMFPHLSVHQQESFDIPNPVDAYAQDLTHVREDLGYEPAYDLKEGIQDWLKTKEELEGQYSSADTEFLVKSLL